MGCFTGLQHNRNKTEGLWINSWEHENVGNIKCSLEVKVLGVRFGKNKI